MRRSSLPLLLALLLVFAQQGAVLHELGHLSAGGQHAGAALHADVQPSSGAICPSCQGFAQVANPAGAPAATTTLDPQALTPIAAASHAIVSADSPTPRSRGPPSV